VVFFSLRVITKGSGRRKNKLDVHTLASFNLAPSIQPQTIQTKRPFDSLKFAQISLGTQQQHETNFISNQMDNI